MEEHVEVKVYLVKKRCPECREGYMNPTGVHNPTYPPLVHHKCDLCGNVEKYSGVTYPHKIYKEVE